MNLGLEEIASMVNGELDQSSGAKITGVAPLEHAGPGDLSYLADLKVADKLASTKAGCVLLPRSEKGKIEFSGTRIWADNPQWAFVQIFRIKQSSMARKLRTGIHPSAMVDPTATIGKDACVLQGAVVEEGATVGAGSVVHPGSYVGSGAILGEGVVLHPGARVLDRCLVGNRSVLHAGAVIGSDGFGYVQVDGRHEKIPQLGIVVVEDDVEIGANVTIDRATHGETRIGRGTKIDNLAQIAHNVTLGKSCIIVSQVGIAGSCDVGDGAILAGQAGIPDHIKIGKGAVVLAQTGVTKDVPDGTVVFGSPARPVKEAMRIEALLNRLPDLVQDVKKLKKKTLAGTPS